jgi:Helix-turn-helix domain
MFGLSGKPLSGGYLSFAEREEIALLRAQGYTMQEVARRLGRAASTISRSCGATPPREAASPGQRRSTPFAPALKSYSGSFPSKAYSRRLCLAFDVGAGAFPPLDCRRSRGMTTPLDVAQTATIPLGAINFPSSVSIWPLRLAFGSISTMRHSSFMIEPAWTALRNWKVNSRPRPALRIARFFATAPIISAE